MAAPKIINWHGVVLATSAEDVADNSAGVPRSQMSDVLRTIELLIATPDGNIVVGYRRLFSYNTPIINSIGQTRFSSGDGVLLLISPLGVVLDRKVIQSLSGYNGNSWAWSYDGIVMVTDAQNFGSPDPNNSVRIWSGSYDCTGGTITTKYETVFQLLTNAGTFTTPVLPAFLEGAAADTVNRFMLGFAIAGNSIFGPGEQIYFRQLDLDTGELLTGGFYQFPETSIQFREIVNVAHLGDGIFRVHAADRAITFTATRGSVSIGTTDYNGASAGGSDPKMAYFQLGQVPTDLNTLDQLPTAGWVPSFNDPNFWSVDWNTYISGTLGSPTIRPIRAVTNGKWVTARFAAGLGANTYSPASSTGHQGMNLTEKNWIVGSGANLFTLSEDDDTPGFWIFDRDEVATHIYPIGTPSGVDVEQIQYHRIDHRGYAVDASPGKASLYWALSPQDDGVDLNPYSIVLLMPVTTPTPLRLTQRDDGLGIHGHPRLPITSMPTSQQLARAPRVRGPNTYS